MIIGSTEAILEVKRSIERIAPTDTTVLVSGETGAGKELVAREIHAISPRASGPFIIVHCPSLVDISQSSSARGGDMSESLLSVLMEHFDSARGGTLFLNEIGDLPPAAQNHLLLLFEKSGRAETESSATHGASVRFIAATTRDLSRHSTMGLFRQDLLYRINVFPIHIPPLRERSPDIVLLAHDFLEKYSRKHSKTVHSIAPEVIRMILLYRWPGNVRELENVIEHAVLVCGGATLEEHDLPSSCTIGEPNVESHDTFKELTAAYEKSLIRNALETARGNQSEAARLLGTTKRIIQYKVGLYDIDYRSFRKRSRARHAH